jgi:HK97 family phage major capsid protein
MDFTTYDELFEQSQALIKQSGEIAANKAATAEDLVKAKAMLEDAKALKERSKMLRELEDLKAQAAPEAPAPRQPGKFKSLGDMLTSIYGVSFQSKTDPRLRMAMHDLGPQDGKNGWIDPQTKDLVENIGASGGFTVFPEHLNQLFQMDPLERIFRQRAFVLPMRARVMQIPVLDQTGAPAAGTSSYYGGAIAKWTEEASEKEESQPDFRQVELVAHKLVVYTEASDELMADSAIPLESLLQQLFRSVVLNEEEWAFVNGTGAGQPLGVVTANTATGTGPTIVVARTAAGAIGIGDIFNMVSAFQGRSPIWIAHQNTMPQILGLNGPAGNPSYVWIGNGRDAMPTTLMGYPIFFVENAQPLGTSGDLILADLSKYVIGDRQMVTIDASKHYRFRNDLTSWRAVHRVDGRPWLSAPITYRDGVTVVSPFVILDGAGAS